MRTLSNPTERRKRQVEAAFERDGFRRSWAEVVGDYFAEHAIAYVGPNRLEHCDWIRFCRNSLPYVPCKTIDRALRDLEGLGYVEISRIGNQIVVRRTTMGAYIWAS